MRGYAVEMADRDETRDDSLITTAEGPLAHPPDEPPVVARLVIEIRSDGTRTIARGGLEDVLLGERVAIQAEATTPLALAAQLVKSIFQAPALVRAAARALLPDSRKR